METPLTTPQLAGLVFLALLMFFGFVGLYKGAKWRDYYDKKHNDEDNMAI